MELGKKIRQLRQKAQYTQEQLGEKLGVGAQAVSKWENAVGMPDISLLPALAEVFGVSIDDLFDLTAEQRLNRIENRLAYPSMQVFFYICEYLGVTPSEFFDGGNSAPARRRELHSAVDRLNEAQTELVLTLVRELLNDKGRKP